MKTRNKDIWVYGDLRDRRQFGYSLNVLAKARELAADVSGETVAVLVGFLSERESEQGDAPLHLSIETASKECVEHGADRVYVVKSPELTSPRADLYAEAMIKAINIHEPMLVLFTLTDMNREIAARCARICNAGLIADCVDLRMEDGRVVTTCPSWGGEVMAELTYSDESTIGFATVQPHAMQPVDVAGDPGTIEQIKIDSIALPEGLKLISRRAEPEERRKLEEAETVVIGGAGVGNAEGFGHVRRLAAALGGEVGSTRPPVLQHWVAEDRMIGQTGKTVRPNLLFSVGASGAVQYTAGIMESKTIVAINRDRNAPIFQIADIGVVADAKTLLPLLTAKIRQRVMRDLADVLCDDKGGNARSGFGEKVCKLREAHGWSMEDLAQSTGQTPEFIDQVESEEVVPSVSFLLRLSRSLEVDPGTFLRDDEKNKIQDQRAQAFTKRTKSYYYQTLTPGAENEHLRSFMVTIESRQVHKPLAYKHEGEEFIFVMEGSLEFTLGNKVHHLKPGESIHFNSEVPHKLKNLADEDTRCLVALYTP